MNYSFNANDGLVDLEAISTEYGIPKYKIKEVVPSVWVNGKIRARLQKEFIISLNSSIRPDFLESVLTRLEGKIVASRPDGSLVVRMNKIKNGFDLMHELAGLGFIDFAQPDMEVKIEHMDPLFGKQFQLQNIGQFIDGQQITAGMDLNVVPAWNVTKGGGIKIAVVDDGIENHEDLPNITGGYTPSNGGNGQPENTGKHGMAVAGIISGQHNSIGIKGIAPDAQLQSVNIFTRGTTISHYAQAFYWAVDQGVDVISNAWGFVYEDVEIESINPPKYIIRKGAMCDSNPFPALTSAINFAARHGRNGKGRVDPGNFTPSRSQNRIPIFGTGCESLPSYGSSLSRHGA